METIFTDVCYKVFKVATAKEEDNILLNKLENSISKYKDKMSAEEYEKFKYFVFGHKMIDMHIKRPESVIFTNLVYDAVIKEKEEKKEEEKKEKISLDALFGDIDEQLNK